MCSFNLGLNLSCNSKIYIKEVKVIIKNNLDRIQEEIIPCITDFLYQEVTKRGFKRVIFGLSGGIDSAVVGVLCKKAFPTQTFAICMPSMRSNKRHFEDAKILCDIFQIPYQVKSIQPFEEAYYKENQDADNLRYGNFCARIRMSILYDLSQKLQALVIGTSNYSEILLGYGTLYGDMAYAINPIAPFFKTEIFKLAKMLHIPDSIISKPPSADLFEGQNDESDLGYSYAKIDQLLWQIDAHYKENYHQIDPMIFIQQGFEEKFVREICLKIQKNTFKSQPPTLFQKIF